MDRLLFNFNAYDFAQNTVESRLYEPNGTGPK